MAVVNRCIEKGRLKDALQAAKGLGLEQHFPDLERQQREDNLERLSNKQLWAQACHFVRDDAHLQASQHHLQPPVTST
jgi:hypothetical protein